MRLSSNFALPLAALLFVLLLVPQAALAGTKNCPVEPKLNTPIATGDLFIGSNCTLHAIGDVDGFVFNANSGDIYQFAVEIIGTAPTNICLTLYDPNLKPISFGSSGCTNIGDLNRTFQANATLTLTGSYTVNITEAAPGGVVNYALALERLYPFPPNAQQLKQFGKVIAGDITRLFDSNPWLFKGVTTGTYRVSVTLAPNPPQNLCVTIYSPNGTTVTSRCTNIGDLILTVQVDFTPTQDGMYMAFLQVLV